MLKSKSPLFGEPTYGQQLLYLCLCVNSTSIHTLHKCGFMLKVACQTDSRIRSAEVSKQPKTRQTTTAISQKPDQNRPCLEKLPYPPLGPPGLPSIVVFVVRSIGLRLTNQWLNAAWWTCCSSTWLQNARKNGSHKAENLGISSQYRNKLLRFLRDF